MMSQNDPYLEPPGTGICEHVGSITGHLAVDSAPEQFVDEHDYLHPELPRRHHDHQLRALHHMNYISTAFATQLLTGY